MAETPQQKLTRLKTLAASGVAASTMDGESATMRTMAEIRREIYLLEVQCGYRRKRPRVMTLNMGNR